MERSKQTAPASQWLWWSTRDSIYADVPSISGIVETLLAIILYWWVAIHFETYLPLIISAAAAPLVLLRSEESVALGVKWFRAWHSSTGKERKALQRKTRAGVATATALAAALLTTFVMGWYFSRSAEGSLTFWRAAITAFVTILVFLIALGMSEIAGSDAISEGTKVLEDNFPIDVTNSRFELAATLLMAIFFMPVVFGLAIAIYLLSIAIRVTATLLYLSAGIRALPRNFRRLILCTSPRQVPELIPGLGRDHAAFTFEGLIDQYRKGYASSDISDRYLTFFFFPLVMSLWFLPGWLYRVTLKSTAWFWWPLAFLGGDLRHANHPDLFRQKIMETLWAKVSVALAFGTIFAFVFTSLLLDAAVNRANPFLSVVGFLFLIDWSLHAWQLLAVAAATLSVAILFWTDAVCRELSYATERKDPGLRNRALQKFGWIERAARLRLILILAFWILVGVHTVLYFNSLRCWFKMPANAYGWTQWVYGDRAPPSKCAKAGSAN